MLSEKKIYDNFIEEGTFEELFPSLTGEWSKDKKEFLKIYEELKEFL